MMRSDTGFHSISLCLAAGVNSNPNPFLFVSCYGLSKDKKFYLCSDFQWSDHLTLISPLYDVVVHFYIYFASLIGSNNVFLFHVQIRVRFL